MSGVILCQESSCVRSNPVSGVILCQESSCVRSHLVSGGILCQESSCVRRHLVDTDSWQGKQRETKKTYRKPTILRQSAVQIRNRRCRECDR